jgi:hypothetical protein
MAMLWSGVDQVADCKISSLANVVLPSINDTFGLENDLSKVLND